MSIDRYAQYITEQESRNLFTSKDKEIEEEVEDTEMYIKLLSPEEFDQLAEDDQNVYIDAINQLQELSPETYRSYRKKATKWLNRKGQPKPERGSPEARAQAAKNLGRMGAIDRSIDKEIDSNIRRSMAARKAK